MKRTTFRSDANDGCAAKGTNPANPRDVGDLAEAVVVHDKVGVDEAAPSDTIVLLDYCVMAADTACKAVEKAPTLPMAGGGTCMAEDPKASSWEGVDKTLTNLLVTNILESTGNVVDKPGS